MSEQSNKAALIKLLVLDVDGVLTDGRLYYGPDGEALKVFQVKDGSAIKRLRRAGIEVAVITAKSGKALDARMRDLGISRVSHGISDKGAELHKLRAELQLATDQICYVGDDELDLPCLTSGALAVCPQDAYDKVRQCADIITKAKGGEGVIAELATLLLDAQDIEASDFHVVIPARFKSTRFPGKPLALIQGRPMIQWVYEKAKASRAKSVIIATDDHRIKEACEGFCENIVLTSESCVSGSDRIGEVVSKKRYGDQEIIVNLQGDEPQMPPEWIDRVATLLAKSPQAEMATLAVDFQKEDDVLDPNLVKVVCDQRGKALYFSRSCIPFDRDGNNCPTYLRHVGLYAYRAAQLKRLVSTPACALEKAESLEQLRALWLGMNLMVEKVSGCVPVGIDTPEDLEKVQTLEL